MVGRFCLSSGLRPGEALGLTWERGSLQLGRIVFEATDQKNAKPGIVPINDGTCEGLLSRAAFPPEHRPSSPWVLADRNGARIGSIRRSFESAARRAGLEDLHPHDLRRTFGNWLVQEGVGIERVSQLMRHSDHRRGQCPPEPARS